jgi:hypothetical protein
MEFVEASAVSDLMSGSLFGIISSTLFTISQDVFMADYQPMTVSQPWRADVIDKAQYLVGEVAKVTIQTLPADASTQSWRSALKMQEVAKDDGLASYAVNVDKALTYGFRTIGSKNNFKIMRKLANIAVGTVQIQSEEAVMSRHRILAGIGMAEAAMGQKYTTVDEALQAKETTVAVLEDEAKIAYANCDNPLFLELRKYIIEFSKMMNDLAYRLPGLVVVDFMGGVHSLVAAYAIYKNAKRHRHLEQRNQIDPNGRMGALVVGVTPGPWSQ